MATENRKKLKCDGLTYNKTPAPTTIQVNIPTGNSFHSLSDIDTETSQESIYYITQRKKQKQTSQENLTTSYWSRNSNSLPDFSRIITSDNLQVLKLELMRLQTELNIANNEIKNLNAINTELNKKNQEQEKIIELYKTINVDELNPSKVLTNPCMSTPLGNQSEKVKRYPSYKKEFPLPEDGNKKHIATIPIHANKRDFTSRNNIIDTSKPINYTEKHIFNTKPNICIISGISNHKQSSIKRDKMMEQSAAYSHYRTPGGDIDQLSRGLQEKLANFTLNDFCILMIGDTDFKVSKNYKNIVYILKQRILAVQHTNIIICLPTPNGLNELINKR
ncbi:unnamed protein product [Parnassius apollo]|uniref:(apollo) hypothetical protein n=1 Tax=Parnassius apollo TaxID=110799 RepID=A0A8S3X6Y9_PARAO|nr:unnamed protein product [Parnassius apollo]